MFGPLPRGGSPGAVEVTAKPLGNCAIGDYSNFEMYVRKYRSQQMNFLYRFHHLDICLEYVFLKTTRHSFSLPNQ